MGRPARKHALWVHAKTRRREQVGAADLEEIVRQAVTYGFHRHNRLGAAPRRDPPLKLRAFA
jgi:hypothetical protein